MGLGKKKKDGAADGGDAKAKKGKGNLVPAVVIAVGLILGGKMMGGGGTTAAASSEPTTTTTAAPGPVVALEPMTMNIEGGSILKVGMALQLHADAAEGAAGGHGAAPAEDDPHKGYARVLDIAIEVFGGRTYADLVGSEGREAAKHELVERLREVYHEEIEDVYLTEFVMSE